MAGIASKPMAIFRRPESPKPLHARWGDVAISVPTDGSWNQYDNPHRPPPERQSYGPGFVPDCSPSDRGHDALGSNSTKVLLAMSRDEDNKSPPTDRAAGISRRNSLSLGGLRPTRLSVRLASRPKHLRGESSLERASHYAEHKKPEFAYKPIHQDYPAEISEKTERPPHRYRYIPTNGRYLEDIPSPRSPRSQSATSFRGSHSRRDSFTESLESQERERERERGREQGRLNSRQSYYPEDDRQSVRSSIAGSSDGTGAGSRLSFGLPPRRRTSPFVAADRKRSSSLKPMTLAMVPDPEDLYE